MILIGFLLFTLTTAFSSEVGHYRIGDVLYAFTEVDGLSINQSCLDKKCEAYLQAKKFQNTSVPASLLRGGKNPFTVKCKEILHGTVIIGQDFQRNEQSFCTFPDGSYLKS